MKPSAIAARVAAEADPALAALLDDAFAVDRAAFDLAEQVTDQAVAAHADQGAHLLERHAQLEAHALPVEDHALHAVGVGFVDGGYIHVFDFGHEALLNWSRTQHASRSGSLVKRVGIDW